jgi:16S rRNA (guanine(966)-N(2))-methyltransferase RsmD
VRVIGGEFRSRPLKSLPGLDVRPTPDRLRESLFNILAPRIQDAVFVDICAGTGAVGIEALSRGASRAVFIEQNRAAVNLIRENLRSLHLESRAEVRQGRAAATLPKLERQSWHIVFIDPPYRLEEEYERVLIILSDPPPPLVVVQHASRHQLAESYGRLTRKRVLRQGDNSLSFYQPD